MYCYPLTLLDLHSHYLLRCHALPSTAVHTARALFVRAFTEYGLPEVLRTDNGVPFAQPNALGRLGALALWWIRLGIRPEHITPATPSENGAHERFHKTLKAATTQPRSASLPAQQALRRLSGGVQQRPPPREPAGSSAAGEYLRGVAPAVPGPAPARALPRGE